MRVAGEPGEMRQQRRMVALNKRFERARAALLPLPEKLFVRRHRSPRSGH